MPDENRPVPKIDCCRYELLGMIQITREGTELNCIGHKGKGLVPCNTVVDNWVTKLLETRIAIARGSMGTTLGSEYMISVIGKKSGTCSKTMNRKILSAASRPLGWGPVPKRMMSKDTTKWEKLDIDHGAHGIVAPKKPAKMFARIHLTWLQVVEIHKNDPSFFFSY